MKTRIATLLNKDTMTPVYGVQVKMGKDSSWAYAVEDNDQGEKVLVMRDTRAEAEDVRTMLRDKAREQRKANAA